MTARQPPTTMQPVTIGHLINANKLLWVYCLSCYREADVDPATLPLPPTTPVPTLGVSHMRCSACGSRHIETKPELYPGGIKALRERYTRGGSTVV